MIGERILAARQQSRTQAATVPGGITSTRLSGLIAAEQLVLTFGQLPRSSRVHAERSIAFHGPRAQV